MEDKDFFMTIEGAEARIYGRWGIPEDVKEKDVLALEVERIVRNKDGKVKEINLNIKKINE